MTENELLQDCLRRLNACGLPYYLTGSMASNYWGLPRATHDIDFVVQLRAEDVTRLSAEFQRDFFLQESSVRSGLGPPFQFNALDARSALKVDFWVLTEDVFAQTMFSRRRSVVLFDTPAWIASAEDVLLHKLLWNKMNPSDRQLLDAAGIWAIQGDKLDLTYLQDWAVRLQVNDTFARIQSGELRPKNG